MKTNLYDTIDFIKIINFLRKIIITLLLCLISLIAGLMLSTSLREEGTFIYNCTESLPQFLFKRENRARNVILKRGDYVEICPIYSKVEYFFKLNPHMTGTCDSGIKPFLKKIAAVPGDYIEVSNKTGMNINGQRIRNTQALSSKVKHFIYKGKVPEHQYLVYTDNPEGYDSRYFGFISLDEITFKIKPIL